MGRVRTTMGTRRWAAVALAVCVFAVVPVSAGSSIAATGTIIDEGWVPSFPQGSVGMQGVRFREIGRAHV